MEDTRREVEIMRHLPEHPNIASFEEAYEDRDAVRLVMELCRGGELIIGLFLKGITPIVLLQWLPRPF